jgi:hypothetical protein
MHRAIFDAALHGIMVRLDHSHEISLGIDRVAMFGVFWDRREILRLESAIFWFETDRMLLRISLSPLT